MLYQSQRFQNCETRRSWDFKTQGKTPYRHCQCFCCLYTRPIGRETYGFHICLQWKYKNFSDPSCHTPQSWCLMAKSTSWVLPNKNNLSDRVPCLQITPISAQKLQAQSQGPMKPVPRAQVCWMLTSRWFIVAIFACPELQCILHALC